MLEDEEENDEIDPMEMGRSRGDCPHLKSDDQKENK